MQKPILRLSLKKWMLAMVVWLMGSTAMQAQVVETVSTLSGNRSLDAAYELHITSADNPIDDGVVVSLNHQDAWVFFENIKPSLVSDNHLDHIQVNGVAFENGTNGRIAIYAHGTVLMPHANSFRPLTVYTEENFGGESAQYAIHTYYNNLGTFNNAIKSFKLKRGYQATFATSSDGKGYSRVFVADKEDLEFEVMPDFLDGNISFIRVFKHQWVTKKGWAGWNWNEYQMVNATWYYDWNIGGSTSLNLEYATIKQHGGWPSWNDINGKTDVSQLLGFNEPDRPDQANMTFDAALSQWPQYMTSGLRLGSPATSDPFNNWSLFNFIDKCDELNYRVDFVAIHCYWGGKSAQNWYNDLKYIHERTGRPIWITEWNNGANWTNETWPDDPSEYTTANAQKQLNDMIAILNVLDTASFVERYSIYNWVEDARAMVLNGELTPAGEHYANNKSQMAYNKDMDVIPGWNYTHPTLALRHLTLTNSIRLNWSDANGDLSKAYKLEKKVDNQPYEEIYYSNDVSVLSFIDNLDPAASGSVTYRLSLETLPGEFVGSNEVSYYQTGGESDVQAGVFGVNSLDWSQSIFAKKYTASPKVILGVPSFSNVVPMAPRVNSASTTSFVFKLQPWNYLNAPSLSKADNISVLAMPAGIYNFGGLKGVVGEAPEVDKNWLSVTFDEVFETIPVVFCTQVSNRNSFATTVAVRNITETGFELRLKSEEAVTASGFAEKVNFLAIETGSGKIDNYRVTVGQTAAGEEVSTDAIKVPYDNSYTKPVVFAGLLTESNAFASTIRYYSSGANEVSLFKQREMSGSLAKMEKDHMGWMIMDLGADQPTSVNSIEANSELPFYPNPVTDVMHFNFEVPTQVEIFDMSGMKWLESSVQQQLDVSALSPGVYFIKTEQGVAKFIKR
ncbi:glycosyl hydrolase [Geofilum rubicundum]|uniref:Secretion system C-terminal sorting domain-containing protein n=1 Tax=Geofilum rubicundum JCM 15548 TaxID=1236989 RepID=A0A0E9LZT7_9BACT|nr:glycosyl hydrolase [Geofilum rubicundum]GAO30828.1 hypothetical protein JCM15548_13142 [Geofilum rubicundum JCM 15548]